MVSGCQTRIWPHFPKNSTDLRPPQASDATWAQAGAAALQQRQKVGDFLPEIFGEV